MDGLRVGRGVVLGLRFEPGVHVLWGGAEEGGAEIARVLCGLMPPRRGKITIGGREPFADPDTRRRIASVLEDEPPLVGKTVLDHFARLQAARRAEAFEALEERAPWLTALKARSASSLDERERRSVAAALLFAEPAPDVAVLYEPSWLAPELDAERLLSRLRELSEDAVVICITSDLRAARRFGGHIWSISGRSLPDEKHANLLLRSDSPRALMARLAAHPAVTALHFQETSPRELWVRGTSPEPLCAAAREAVLAEQCELFEMTLLGLGDEFFDKRSQP
jgi:ABC-type cobalamin/Fe3+-siderophores transport system ATPase subunit